MASLSYCAFENTVPDLRQCVDMLHEEAINSDKPGLQVFKKSRSSDYERRAVDDLYELCQQYIEAYEQAAEYGPLEPK